MKKTINKSLAFLLAAVMLLGASPIIGIGSSLIANAASESDLTFALINNGTEYEVSGCYWSASGDLTIPATHDGKPVTSIGETAFYDCESLESITIPDSVTNIGVRAFQYCKGITNITIPNSVMSLSEYAFYYCTSLESVTFAEGIRLESIGSSAFAGCSKMKSIIIPESITSIGDSAFFECTGLVSVTFAEGSKLESISSSLFSNCLSMKSIIIPESVTSIDSDAFFCCFSLESITIPEGVKSIDANAFYGCQSLFEIIVAESNANYSSVDGVLFSKNGKALVCYPEGKSGTSYEIPASVTKIGKYAFENCDNILSVTFAEGSKLERIGERAFFYCESLESITIPESVMSIGIDAFGDTAYYKNSDNWIDNALYIGDCFIEASSECTSCDIAENTRLIADAAFCNAYGLMSIYVPESNENYSSEYNVLFSKAKDVLISYPCAKYGTSYNIPESVTSIGNRAFCYCDNLESIHIPNGVTGIGDNAFEGCYGLLSVTFAEDGKLESIGNRVFIDCNSLESIDIPYGITSIGNDAFKNCESLERVTIPEGVTSIGNDAFEDCESLDRVTIPESVTYIGEDAFEDCDYISDIYYGGDESDWKEVYLGPDNGEVYNAVWHYSIVVTDVTLDITTKTLFVGATQQLTEAVAPEDATNQKVTWASSDPTIASVDKNGIVTAKAEGTATITVTTRNKSKTATCVVTVKDPQIVKIEIQTFPNDLTCTYKKDSFDKAGLTIKATYENGKFTIINDIDEINVTGFDSNKSGKQELTVEYGGVQAEEKITVKVEYTFLQWLIVIILFGWIWY